MHATRYRHVTVKSSTPITLPRFNRVAGRVLRLFNPLARWMISAGIPTGAPNVLLTVRGWRSGKPRTVPLGLLELDGTWYVQACYGETGWVANLREAGEATVTQAGGKRVAVEAIELSPEASGRVLQRALEPFGRSRVFRAMLGPRARGPAAILRAFQMRIDETLDEYTETARRFPLFELRPIKVAD